jgi:hypothetical protein
MAVIVATEDQPVARGRVLQHLGRHRHVIFHFAGNRHAEGLDFATAAAGRSPRAHDWRQSATTAAACSRGRWRCATVRHRVEGRLDTRRQRLRARRRAVDLQQVSGDIEISGLTEYARTRWRHRLNDVGEQLVDRAWAPLIPEVDAGYRRRVTASTKIGAVASRALLRVCGLTSLCLRRRKDATGRGRRLLPADGGDGESNENSRSQNKRGPWTVHV